MRKSRLTLTGLSRLVGPQQALGWCMTGRIFYAAEGVARFLEKRPPVFPEKVSQDMPELYPWRGEPGYE